MIRADFAWLFAQLFAKLRRAGADVSVAHQLCDAVWRVTNGDRVVIVPRGLPGAGKSFLCSIIHGFCRDIGVEFVEASTDKYFCRSGKYVFGDRKEARQYCGELLRGTRRGVLVCLSNPNLDAHEIKDVFDDSGVQFSECVVLDVCTLYESRDQIEALRSLPEFRDFLAIPARNKDGTETTNKRDPAKDEHYVKVLKSHPELYACIEFFHKNTIHAMPLCAVLEMAMRCLPRCEFIAMLEQTLFCSI